MLGSVDKGIRINWLRLCLTSVRLRAEFQTKAETETETETETVLNQMENNRMTIFHFVLISSPLQGSGEISPGLPAAIMRLDHTYLASH